MLGDGERGGQSPSEQAPSVIWSRGTPSRHWRPEGLVFVMKGTVCSGWRADGGGAGLDAGWWEVPSSGERCTHGAEAARGGVRVWVEVGVEGGSTGGGEVDPESLGERHRLRCWRMGPAGLRAAARC